MSNSLWEVGSEFHWEGLPESSFVPWPTPHVLYALGRDAMLGILEISSFDKGFGVLYLPSFFCSDVVTSCQEWGATIQFYEDHPLRSEPDLSSVSLGEGDAILAVNYFGVRDGHFWSHWKSENNTSLLIEDHTHDPLSAWVKDSIADYCFSSVRKTFPVPDGAIAWSPVHTLLPREHVGNNWRGSALKLAAMLLKKEYLDGRPVSKSEFRKLQIEGEGLFSQDRGLSISPWSHSILQLGYPTEWRRARERNVRHFLDLIPDTVPFTPLFKSWPMGHCPFNCPILFNSQEERERTREKLVEENIFAPVHWALSRATSMDSIVISSRILTVPLDQRYGAADVERIISVLLNN